MGRGPRIAAGLAAALALAGAGRAVAQDVHRTPTGLGLPTADGARVEVALPCPTHGMTREGARVYLAAGRCGVVRLEVGPNDVRRADQLLVGLEVVGVFHRDGAIYGQVHDLGPVFVDAPSLPWSAGGMGGPELRAAHPDATSEFATPDMGSATPVTSLAIRVRRSLPPPPSPRVATPPRHGDSWEMGGEGFGFLATDSDSGFGLLARSWLVYRASIPLSLRLDLMPVGLAVSDATYGTGLGLVSAGLDYEGIALGVGVGATSYRGSYGELIDTAALALGAHVRFGVADGLHFALRSGLHFDHQDEARFTFVEGVLQVPLTRRVALFWRGSVAIEPLRAQLDHGVRVWVHGHGEPGSVALRCSFGWGFERGQEPPTCRSGSCWSSSFDLSGPGAGVGVEGRL